MKTVSKFTMFTIVMVVCFSTVVTGGDKCKEFNRTDVDQKWFLESAAIGFRHALGIKLQAKQGLDSPPPPSPNKDLKNELCWSVDVKIVLGIIPIPFRCRNNRVEEETCVLKTEGTPVQKIIKFYGDFTALKTDNKTYILFHGCLQGVKDFWSLLYPIGQNVSAEDKETNLKYIVKLGFSRKKEHLRSENDEISFDHMRTVPCGDTVGNMPHGAPGVPKAPEPPTPAETPSMPSTPGEVSPAGGDFMKTEHDKKKTEKDEDQTETIFKTIGKFISSLGGGEDK